MWQCEFFSSFFITRVNDNQIFPSQLWAKFTISLLLIERHVGLIVTQMCLKEIPSIRQFNTFHESLIIFMYTKEEKRFSSKRRNCHRWCFCYLPCRVQHGVRTFCKNKKIGVWGTWKCIERMPTAAQKICYQNLVLAHINFQRYCL